MTRAIGGRCSHTLVHVGEGLEVDVGGIDTPVFTQPLAELVVAEGKHAAVCVADHERLPRAEQRVRDNDRAQGVVGGQPTGVADHMSVSLLEPERLGGIEARIHAGQHREAPAWWHGQLALRERGGVGLVSGPDLVEHGQPDHPTSVWEVSKLLQMK